MSQRGRLEIRGSTALVTGRSARIGLAGARHLASAGADLVIAARHAQSPEETAVRLRDTGVKVLAVPADVGRTDDLARLVESAISERGTIDILVNNAGIE